MNTFLVPARRRYISSVSKTYGYALIVVAVVHPLVPGRHPSWWVTALEIAGSLILFGVSLAVLPDEG